MLKLLKLGVVGIAIVLLPSLAFAQGAISVELRHTEGKKPFCFPSPAPTRTVTMNEFVGWVRSMPDHRKPPAVDGLLQFLGERYPCK